MERPNVVGHDGLEVIEDRELGDGEVKIKQIVVTTVDDGEPQIVEQFGSVLVSSLYNADNDGFNVSMLGDIQHQIEAVNAIVHGVVARINSQPDPLGRIWLMSALSRAVQDGFSSFNVLGGSPLHDESEPD